MFGKRANAGQNGDSHAPLQHNDVEKFKMSGKVEERGGKMFVTYGDREYTIRSQDAKGIKVGDSITFSGGVEPPADYKNSENEYVAHDVERV